MDNESLYKTHAEKFTEHPIQTFDAMVLLCRTPKRRFCAIRQQIVHPDSILHGWLKPKAG